MIDKIETFLNKLPFFKRAPLATIIFLQIICGLVLCTIAVLLFVEVAESVFEEGGHDVDVLISQYVYGLRNPFLNEVMTFISLLGIDFTLIAGSLIAIFLAWRRHRHEALLFVCVLGVGFVINNALKVLYQRPRPSIDPLYDLTWSYSFPSTHAMNSFIFYCLLAYFVYHFTKNRTLSFIAAIAAVVLIGLIGLSRVYLGVHYPSDILAGYIAGLFVFVTAIVLDKTITWMKLRNVRKKK